MIALSERRNDLIMASDNLGLTALARQVGRMRDVEQVRAAMYAARAAFAEHSADCARCDFDGDYPRLCEDADILKRIEDIYSHRLGALLYQAGQL